MGTDWLVWLNGLKRIYNKNNYEWILLLNDSILFPIHGIIPFQNTINEMRKDVDFWGHWSSEEINFHLIGTPIEIKCNLIQDVIHFILDGISKCNNDMDYIYKLETKLTPYLINKGYKYNTVVNYKDLNYPINTLCLVFNPIVIEQWIHSPNTFAIKWKYMISYLNENNLSKELNYLTRFLYYGPYGTLSKGEIDGAFPKSLDFCKKHYNI
jgi:hypothetical protein